VMAGKTSLLFCQRESTRDITPSPGEHGGF
jgi:hypothetical protein